MTATTSRRPRRRQDKPGVLKVCAICGERVVADTLASAERAFDAHYVEQHANNCHDCGRPVLWLRLEDDVHAPPVRLDAEAVDIGGLYIVHPGPSQNVARTVEPGHRGLVIHVCPRGANRAR